MAIKAYEEQTFKDIQSDSEAWRDLNFSDCLFENCNFMEPSLNNVSFHECRFENCTVINPQLEFSSLRNAEIAGCNLIGINWSALSTNKYALLIDKMSDSLLKYNNFIDLQLPKFSFASSEILNSNFEGCNLKGANFRGCSLEGTQFIDNDLRASNFTDASGYIIDLESNQLKKASFSLPEALHLLDSLEIKLK